MEPDIDDLIDRLCIMLCLERASSRTILLSKMLSGLLELRTTQVRQRWCSMDDETVSARISALCKEISDESDYAKVLELCAHLQKFISIRDRLAEGVAPEDAMEDYPRTGTLDS